VNDSGIIVDSDFIVDSELIVLTLVRNDFDWLLRYVGFSFEVY
jgi:hypothetical protein